MGCRPARASPELNGIQGVVGLAVRQPNLSIFFCVKDELRVMSRRVLTEQIESSTQSFLVKGEEGGEGGATIAGVIRRYGDGQQG